MTLSSAEAKGLERASKYAKSTKYGRQNPISARWNSEDQLVVWRAAWAATVNMALEQKGLEERIDHRSHAERGLEEQPTIHEGVAARAMEAKGFVSDRCELNRQIKADNALLRILRDTVEKITVAFESTAAGIAAALEVARERIIISTYGIRHIINQQNKLFPSIERRIKLKQQYDDVRKSIRTTAKERKALQAEKKALSPLHIKRHLELASSIAGLTEEIEELRSQKKHILARAKCDDDKGMKTFTAKLDQAKRNYNDLIERKTALAEERQDGITQYEDVYERILPGDEEAVKTERQWLRAESESRISETVSGVYGEAFDAKLLSDATKETDLDLAFDRRVEEHRKVLHDHNISRHKRTPRQDGR